MELHIHPTDTEEGYAFLFNCCLIWALSKTLHPRFDTCVVCRFVMRHVAGFIMDGTHTMMSVWALTSHDTHDTNTAQSFSNET